MPIFAVRTTAGRERQVVDKLLAIAEKRQVPVYAILNPAKVKGYILVEAASKEDITQAIYGMPHAKGVIPNQINPLEIEHFITAAPKEIKIKIGDIVEIVSGPFKGDKARVVRVTPVKEEVVVEILEAAVPIPVTISTDAIRKIQEAGQSDEDSDA